MDFQSSKWHKFFWKVKWSKFDQKTWFFGSFCEQTNFFVYALLHLMNCTPRFCQMKDLFKIYICGRFHQYSICGCEIKIFKVSCIESASMKWPLIGFFGPYSPNYCFILDEILTRDSPIRQRHFLKNPSKFWNLAQIECTESSWFWSILGPKLLLENQKFA